MTLPRALTSDPEASWQDAYYPIQQSWEEVSARYFACQEQSSEWRDARGMRFGQHKLAILTENVYVPNIHSADVLRTITTRFTHRACHASSVAAFDGNVWSGTLSPRRITKRDENAGIAPIASRQHPIRESPAIARPPYSSIRPSAAASWSWMEPAPGQPWKRFPSHMLQSDPAADVSMWTRYMHDVVKEKVLQRPQTNIYRGDTPRIGNMRPRCIAHLKGLLAENVRMIAGIDAETSRSH